MRGQAMSLIETMDGYSGVSSVLDKLTTSLVTPVGWRWEIYSAIDHLRASSAPEEQIDIAERISATLLKLDWAIQRGDGEKQEKARQQLSILGASWHSASAPQSLDEVLELREVETINQSLARLNGRSM
jgi:hypothetical protein